MQEKAIERISAAATPILRGSFSGGSSAGSRHLSLGLRILISDPSLAAPIAAAPVMAEASAIAALTARPLEGNSDIHGLLSPGYRRKDPIEQLLSIQAENKQMLPRSPSQRSPSSNNVIRTGKGSKVRVIAEKMPLRPQQQKQHRRRRRGESAPRAERAAGVVGVAAVGYKTPKEMGARG